MKRSEINKLDKIAREKVRENFDGKCAYCGKGNANLHHIEGRRILSCRWYFPNLILLCPLHHTFGTFSAHQSPLKFHSFLVDTFGNKFLMDIQKQSNKSFKGSYQDVLDYLEGRINNYA
jgi:hypothetical protein